MKRTAIYKFDAMDDDVFKAYFDLMKKIREWARENQDLVRLENVFSREATTLIFVELLGFDPES